MHGSVESQGLPWIVGVAVTIQGRQTLITKLAFASSALLQRHALLEKDSNMLRIEINIRSRPLAATSLLATEPLSSRNLSCRKRCWNSKLRLQTSSSLSCRADPRDMRGDIQETVMNCHNVRLSSGLRSWWVGLSKAGLIPNFGSLWSLNGMQKIMPTITSEKKMLESTAILFKQMNGTDPLRTATISAKRKPIKMASRPNGAVLGRSTTVSKVAIA